jgi:DNA-binding NtrC family response regulator
MAGTGVNVSVSRCTVLLVDPDEAVRTGLGRILAAAGHAVVICRGFEEGRRYLETQIPHAIVTDVRLGAFNGLHLVSLAKQKAPTIAAVVYSGHEDSGIGSDAVMQGATYLDKDTLAAHLISHLERAIRE